MKYNVLQTITRRSENMKVYHPGDVVEMEGEAGDTLVKQGFLQAIGTKETTIKGSDLVAVIDRAKKKSK